jgi:hypothetical protein
MAAIKRRIPKTLFAMKTISLKIFALLFIVIASFNLAQAKNVDPAESPRVVAADKFAYSLYAINQTNKFRLSFVNELGSRVSVKVYDQEGALVYVDNIKNATELKRNYDLGTLGRGVYTVEISNGEFKTAERVAVGGAKLNQVAFNAYISPSLTDGAFKIAYQGGAAEGVYITVTDANGTILYSEHSESDNFARRYNLASLKPGSYSVSVASGEKSLEQTFMIN